MFVNKKEQISVEVCGGGALGGLLITRHLDQILTKFLMHLTKTRKLA